MQDNRWLYYALLGAVAAALTGVFGRVGVRDIDSTFATTVRSLVMVIFMTSACTVFGKWGHWDKLDRFSLLMIVLSGMCGATSWLLGFKALSLSQGMVYRVGSIDKLSVPIAVVLAAIFLKERPLAINWTGIALIVLGAYLASYSPPKPALPLTPVPAKTNAEL